MDFGGLMMGELVCLVVVKWWLMGEMCWLIINNVGLMMLNDVLMRVSLVSLVSNYG